MSDNIFQYKDYLFTIAYNMLGDIHAAEDVVQDTFEIWLQMDQSKILHPKSYLSRMAVNKAIDVLHGLKKQRDAYKGLWMPEPILSENQEEHTLEYGLLFLLEKLNPQERAVFVLKEAFDFTHDAIADMLQLNTEQCRQLLHRARERVRLPRKHHAVEKEEHDRLLESFFFALSQKNFDMLKQLFRDDIVLYSDGGGKKAAALKPIAGSFKVSKFLAGVLSLDPEASYTGQLVNMNQVTAGLIYLEASIDSVVHIEVLDNKISGIFILRNPEKIRF